MIKNFIATVIVLLSAMPTLAVSEEMPGERLTDSPQPKAATLPWAPKNVVLRLPDILKGRYEIDMVPEMGFVSSGNSLELHITSQHMDGPVLIFKGSYSAGGSVYRCYSIIDAPMEGTYDGAFLQFIAHPQGCGTFASVRFVANEHGHAFWYEWRDGIKRAYLDPAE
jgi:hypothetical protein